MITLQDYTSRESGAIVYEDGNIVIGNWAGINGIPREFAGAWVGLNDLQDENGDLLTFESIEVPDDAKRALLEHEQLVEPGCEPSPDNAFSAIEIPSLNVIVVWSSEWN